MSTCRKRLTWSATSIVGAGVSGAVVSKGLLVGTVDQTCVKRMPATPHPPGVEVNFAVGLKKRNFSCTQETGMMKRPRFLMKRRN
jgi:hypothetical protein